MKLSCAEYKRLKWHRYEEEKDTLTISVHALTVSYHAVTGCTDCKCACTLQLCVHSVEVECALIGNAVSVDVMVTLVATDGACECLCAHALSESSVAVTYMVRAVTVTVIA